jgi:adenylate kinase
VINILGVAGSGKSTQGMLLAERLKCPWVSIGQLLRQKLEGDAREDMLQGKIINDEITLGVLKEDLVAQNAATDEVVLDGFPRTMSQAEWLAGEVEAGNIKMTGIIHLVADKNVAMDRLLQRGRRDDTEEAIHQRFSAYHQTIIPILDYLKSRGLPIYDIDADLSIPEVEKEVDKALGIK